MQAMKNVIVVGGSYVGSGAATKLASSLPEGYRPRFAIVPTHEHKAFIPYTRIFNTPTIPNPSIHSVIRARALSVQPDNKLVLDREWKGETVVPFEYLVVATGTQLPSPGSMQGEEKTDGVGFFKTYQAGVQRANDVVIVGGGAVGVQMALDLKEVHPEKNVTLVHSRDHVMNRFDPRLHAIVAKRCEELGVKLVTGQRVRVPADGYPTDGSDTKVVLANGTEIPTQLVILATGQIPNNHLLRELDSSSTPAGQIINPANGYLRVRPTLQLQHPGYGNIFALGDIADTGAPKAARPGMAQQDVVVRNIEALVKGQEPEGKIEVGPAAIHLTLGLKQNVIFRNPIEPGGEPMIKMQDNGQEDMGIDGVWSRRGFTVKDISEYHL
ncbi:hypothetical protein QFC21_003504 [Naganishia friedmannii]|uniref:Uncharacterized protein n=1 Tax=Naganishia friedmannii TaxID=89922 RepID=A0ACC2VPA7_9TREE|nr:hypothetical protein QFC21_003504 [Naganishia friedmannii]